MRELLADFDEDARTLINRDLALLTAKPTLYVCNVDEAAVETGNAHTEAFKKSVAAENAEVIMICAGIEHKMGIKGSATATLNFGEDGKCIGELLGSERQGMRIMFHMMNEARLEVGIQGLGHASAALEHAVQYAKERIQSTPVWEMKNPDAKAVPIIMHPDVRRDLLWMKAYVEGIRAMNLFVAFCLDMAKVGDTPEERAKYQGFAELLTPVCKAYSSDMACLITSKAIDVYGGYGYCREYPVEQMMRDQKINLIYEGTNGIQAMDLLGRKLGMKKGLYFMNLLGLTQAAIAEAKNIESLKAEAEIVERALNACAATAMDFAKMLKTTPYVPLIAACDYLNCLSDALVGWLHIWMANVATKALANATNDKDKAFYSGKIQGAKFFINRITDLVPAKVENLKKDEQSAMNISEK